MPNRLACQVFFTPHPKKIFLDFLFFLIYNSHMANRVCLGNHPNHGYGLFISRDGVNVLSNIKKEDLIFDSRSSASSLVHEVISASISNGDHAGTTVNFATSLSYVPHVDLVALTGNGGSSKGIPVIFESSFPIFRYYRQFRVKVTTTGVTVSTAWPTITVGADTFFKVVVYKIPSLT